MYHAGQTSDQFRIRKPLLSDERIINVVIAVARKIARVKLIRINRTAWQIPQCSAGEVAFRVRNAEGGYKWFLSRAEPL
jgi:hypothetical protein